MEAGGRAGRPAGRHAGRQAGAQTRTGSSPDPTQTPFHCCVGCTCFGASFGLMSSCSFSLRKSFFVIYRTALPPRENCLPPEGREASLIVVRGRTWSHAATGRCYIPALEKNLKIYDYVNCVLFLLLSGTFLRGARKRIASPYQPDRDLWKPVVV